MKRILCWPALGFSGCGLTYQDAEAGQLPESGN